MCNWSMKHMGQKCNMHVTQNYILEMNTKMFQNVLNLARH